MRISVQHEIIRNPVPEDAGTIKVLANVDGFDELYQESTLVEEFLEDVCSLKEDLNYFLIDSGISDDDTFSAMTEIINHVDEVTSSASTNYSPGYALEVFLSITYDPQNTEEAIRVSFNETSNIRFKPASKLVVKSLTRKIYKKISPTGETCTICLEEFTDGGRLVTLPCGHEFDEDCAVKWFETSHLCPLCRNKLPCEDQ